VREAGGGCAEARRRAREPIAATPHALCDRDKAATPGSVLIEQNACRAMAAHDHDRCGQSFEEASAEAGAWGPAGEPFWRRRAKGVSIACVMTLHHIAPILTTERLTLRGHHPDDFDALTAMWAEPAVYERIGGKPRHPEDVWIRLLRSIGQWAAFGYGAWVVCDRASGAVLGEIGLLEARRAITPQLTVPEMGWTLVTAAHGKGYAGEAMGAALAWADGHGIARTCCIIDPGNAASIRLAAKLGYGAPVEGLYHERLIGIYHRG
jgi:RimJ/RimL family protein N-acetyltransferase